MLVQNGVNGCSFLSTCKFSVNFAFHYSSSMDWWTSFGLNLAMVIYPHLVHKMCHHTKYSFKNISRLVVL